MTSDKDDLEQALQENLRLRRELGVAAGKARGGMAYRLGWALFWTCLALIAAWLFFF
jgi:streptomycin 6-kinase